MSRKTKKIIVNLQQQTLTAYEDSVVIHKFPCITGEADHPTPTGSYRINRKHKKYTSRTYGAPMDYAMFFTLTGEAIHKYHGPWLIAWMGRKITNEVGSKGCVRLKEEDAITMFDWAPMNTLVIVQ
jgi:lipoprotein-anchoring transpeptidase ErfK/SrfK